MPAMVAVVIVVVVVVAGRQAATAAAAAASVASVAACDFSCTAAGYATFFRAYFGAKLFHCLAAVKVWQLCER